MNIEFSNKKLKKQFSNATEIKKAFGEMAKKVSVRYDQMRNSPNLMIFMQIPAADCHQLKGNRTGEWAASISVNHRLIFEIDHDPIPTNEDNSIDTSEVTNIMIT